MTTNETKVSLEMTLRVLTLVENVVAMVREERATSRTLARETLPYDAETWRSPGAPNR